MSGHNRKGLPLSLADSDPVTNWTAGFGVEYSTDALEGWKLEAVRDSKSEALTILSVLAVRLTDLGYLTRARLVHRGEVVIRPSQVALAVSRVKARQQKH